MRELTGRPCSQLSGEVQRHLGAFLGRLPSLRLRRRVSSRFVAGVQLIYRFIPQQENAAMQKWTLLFYLLDVKLKLNMMSKIKPTVVLFALLLLISCSSAPVGNLDKIAAMQNAINGESVLARYTGSVYPDQFKLGFVVESQVFVEIVLTDKALRLVKWREDAQQYVPFDTIRYGEIVRIKKGQVLTLPYVAIQTSGYKFLSLRSYGAEDSIIAVLQSKAPEAVYY